jgi:chromatin structure-remodeling complex subunit RSC4
MSKRELGKLASVVDVDAPRAKRRKEAAPPQDEKKPDAETDVDVDADAGVGTSVKREQEGSAKLEQVKEQGLRLWQTVKDAVDKECVTDLR